ncbi:MAG TPA: hypothetical protein VJQ09_04470 [Candidatus Limnocylindria bacterium]|nr:hypothetical protein [Candidatus Limnocylindria bacterium]
MLDLGRADEGWRRSFAARMSAINGLLDKAVADLTLAQVNHRERAGVLSLAFSLAHVVGGQDRNVGTYLDGGAPLWDAYAARVGYAGEMPRRGTPMSVAEAIQFHDVDAWRDYQRAVFARTDSALANTPIEKFSGVVISERPADTRGAFLFALVPSGSIRLKEVCEAYLFQHAARHLGEIEHARALVGLGGLS